MNILNWILENKVNIGWVTGGAAGTYKVLLLIYKRLYRPTRTYLNRWNKAMLELEHNGGGSIKDVVVKMSTDMSVIRLTQEAEFQLNPDCRFQCSSDGRFTKVNDSLCKLFGGDRDKFLGFGWVSFIAPEERERVREEWEQGVESDSVILCDYHVINGYTNERIICTSVAYVKRNDKNEVVSIFGIINRK